MTIWEYRVVTINTEYSVPSDGKLEDSPESDVIITDCLEEMAEEGWELVTTVPAMPTDRKWKGDHEFANPWVHHFIFKRPKRSPDGSDGI